MIHLENMAPFHIFPIIAMEMQSFSPVRLNTHTVKPLYNQDHLHRTTVFVLDEEVSSVLKVRVQVGPAVDREVSFIWRPWVAVINTWLHFVLLYFIATSLFVCMAAINYWLPLIIGVLCLVCQ